jgi:hypothetical protein
MGNAQRIDGVRIEPESYRPIDITETHPEVRRFVPPVPVMPLFLDLPLMTGEEVPHAPHLAVTARPWPGSVALYSSPSDANYRVNQLVEARSAVGVLESALMPARAGTIDRSDGLTVRMLTGRMESVDNDALLSGANLCAIGDGTPDGWEMVQFRDAVLVDNDTYILSHRLRGQLGTEEAGANGWPEGSYLVVMNRIPRQIDLPDALRRRAQHYRIGPAGRAVDDPSYQHAVLAFEGIGLRPYSPAHLRAMIAADGSTDIQWIRRTRVDGDRWDTPEVPLGEEAESYLLRVVRGSTVLREVTLTRPEWRYDASFKAEDGTTTPFEVHVAQISAKFGPGVFAQIIVAS